jgi:hypothetical protein
MLYFILGFMQLYWLLFMWGFSAGPINWIPYALLFAFLTFLLVGPALSLFMEKPAAVTAFIGGLVGLIWVVWGTFAGGMTFVDVAIVGIAPAVMTAESAARLVWQRRRSWLQVRPGLPVVLRIVLAAVPVGVVATFFDVQLIVLMLWSRVAS